MNIGTQTATRESVDHGTPNTPAGPSLRRPNKAASVGPGRDLGRRPVLSCALPKSGSTLLFVYTEDILQRAFPETGKGALYRGIRDGRWQGRGGFLTKLANDTIADLVDLAAQYGPVTVKSHSALKPSIRHALKANRVLATFIHRDPRDVLLSAMDHRRRTLGTDKSCFEDWNSLRASLSLIKPMLAEALPWTAAKDVCLFRYDRLLKHTVEELTRLVHYLGLNVPTAVLEAIIAAREKAKIPGRLQYNTGKSLRYREEMSAADIRLCNEVIGEEITSLGYSL
jgi:hypothetical protein